MSYDFIKVAATIALVAVGLALLAVASVNTGTDLVANEWCISLGYSSGEWVDSALQCATQVVPR